MKRTLLVCLASCLLFAQSALAADGYPAAKSSRPLTLKAGLFETGLDYDLGLMKDRAFDDMRLGLGASYGIMDQLEVGLWVTALSYGKDAQDAKFGGFDIYARYALLDMLAIQLDVYAPGDRTYIDEFGDQLVGVQLGLPFQYIILNDMLKVHAGLFFDMGFVSDSYATSGGDSPQMALVLDYGVTFNAMQQLWFDLTFGTRMGFKPDAGSLGDRTSIPAALTVGGTLLEGDLDVYATFTISDLKPAAGDAFDSKWLTLGARYRF